MASLSDSPINGEDLSYLDDHDALIDFAHAHGIPPLLYDFITKKDDGTFQLVIDDQTAAISPPITQIDVSDLQTGDDDFAYLLEERRAIQAENAPDGTLPGIVMAKLIAARPPLKRNEPLIDGLLRRREVMNLISMAKVGKTWMVYGMVKAVSQGKPWIGFDTTKTRTLIVDKELHATEIEHRMRQVFATVPENVDYMCLRGNPVDIHGLAHQLPDIISGNGYGLIVLDALYRFLPAGISENDNAQMMGVYNALDALAMRTDCAVVVVHHTSKGDQSGKSVTDVGSGAGAISRCADSHLIFRQHSRDDHVVMDARLRSFPPQNPSTLKWEFPNWIYKQDIEPEVKRSGPNAERKRQEDIKAMREIAEVLQNEDGMLSVNRLANLSAFGNTKTKRLLNDMLKHQDYKDNMQTEVIKARHSTKESQHFAWIS